MTELLVLPHEAGARVAAKIARDWAAAVCTEIDGGEPFRVAVRLRPGVSTGGAVARLGFGVWHDWVEDWRDVAAARLPGVDVVLRRVVVERVPDDVPVELRAMGLDAAVAVVRQTGATLPVADLDRARTVARRLRAAGAVLTPGTLKAVCKLSDTDVGVLVDAAMWLTDHPDLGGWTSRQLPMPGMHSKWLEQHGRVLREVTGRDLRAELRPRLAVVHLTYADPGYLATGGRRHDAWTTGDVHDLAYEPSTVLVVENRDSRLWFPDVDGTIVVEGGGKAAASLLSDVSWVRHARNVVYWGDIDADGFAILAHFRRALAAPSSAGVQGRAVSSILMDGPAVQRYASLGVSTDKEGRPIPPSSAHFPDLSPAETAAYHAVATAGPAELRRIEQERIPEGDALPALLTVLGRTAD